MTFQFIGKRLPRADSLEKAKGEIRFTSDLSLPRMLHARFLRSPHAHARVLDIDTSRAEALLGVRAVLTYKNVPRVRAYTATLRDHQKLEYLLDEVVHYAGEEVAAVAAPTVEMAEAALKLIDVEYEVLPAVFDKEEAMKPGAPLVHPELAGNLYQCTRAVNGKLSLDYGDVDQGFAEADYIIEGTYDSPFQHPVSPEPRAVVCEWVGENLTCWASTHVPQGVRDELAVSLSIPRSRVRVIADHSVGGYGMKQPGKTAVLVALLARNTGRPVKTVFTRAEDLIATHRRIDAKVHARAGIKQDGTITALHTTMITNCGRDSAWGYTIPASAAATTCSMLYESRNSRWEGFHVLTNIEDHGAVNAFGDPEAGFGIERLMDEAAEKIGMSPVAFRLKNCIKAGDRGIELQYVAYGPVEWGIVGSDLDSLPICIRKATEAAGWDKKWRGWQTPVAVNGDKRRGIGIALGIHHCMGRGTDSCTIKMNQDGSADVFSSDPEIGQGLKTSMRQVVAEALGITLEKVNVLLSDTSVTPYAHGVFASRGTLAGAGTAYLAALEIKKQLIAIAARTLGVNAERLAVADGRIVSRDDSEKSLSIAAACLAGYQITATSILPYPFIDEKSGKKVAAVSVAATVAEVEVDTETGFLELVGIWSAHDCGRAINPTLVENQIDLSVTMGNGWVRSEDLVVDKRNGAILNAGLLDYKLMTILDMPKMDELKEILVEVPCPLGPFGAKGMSETAMTSQAPALANAVYNAIGVRIRASHLTPPEILQALGRI